MGGRRDGARTQKGSFQGNREASQRSLNQKLPTWGSQLTTPPADPTLCILDWSIAPFWLKKTMIRLYLDESGLARDHQPGLSLRASLDPDLPVGSWQATQSPLHRLENGMKLLLPRTAHQ